MSVWGKKSCSQCDVSEEHDPKDTFEWSRYVRQKWTLNEHSLLGLPSCKCKGTSGCMPQVESPIAFRDEMLHRGADNNSVEWWDSGSILQTNRTAAPISHLLSPSLLLVHFPLFLSPFYFSLPLFLVFFLTFSRSVLSSFSHPFSRPSIHFYYLSLLYFLSSFYSFLHSFFLPLSFRPSVRLTFNLCVIQSSFSSRLFFNLILFCLFRSSSYSLFLSFLPFSLSSFHIPSHLSLPCTEQPWLSLVAVHSHEPACLAKWAWNLFGEKQFLVLVSRCNNGHYTLQLRVLVALPKITDSTWRLRKILKCASRLRFPLLKLPLHVRFRGVLRGNCDGIHRAGPLRQVRTPGSQ